MLASLQQLATLTLATTTPMTTTRTNDQAIRDLYTAKANLKEAAALWTTAENNLNDMKADRSFTAADITRATAELTAAQVAYWKAEDAYQPLWNECNNLGLL